MVAVALGPWASHSEDIFMYISLFINKQEYIHN